MKRSTTRGFTLVELNLAIVFIAILVIGVAAIVMNVTKINQRGILLKSINQTGREAVEQVRRDVAVSKIDDVQYVAPIGGVGRLCLGTVSYVFNTAEALNGPGTLIRDATKPERPAITFVRMDDRDGQWCQQTSGTFVKNEITASDAATELLQRDTTGTIPVAVHAMDVQVLTPTDGSVNQGLVSFSISIGTNELDTIDTTTCKPPTDHQSNFDNCVVREFRTVIRSNGASRGE